MGVSSNGGRQASSNGGNHLALVSEIAVRIVFAVVFAVNVECALQFIINPETYTSAYQLEGVQGRVALQGLGVAFLMWNATYPLFIWKPSCHKKLGIIIIAQQAIGLAGEGAIFIGLPQSGFDVLASSIMRFIVFDGAGLCMMLASLIWLFLAKRHQSG